MHRVGVAGFQNFDAALDTPQVVDKRLVYMTPEWKDAFKYATVLADHLGLEEAIAGSPGWSESGGPWVPRRGMKRNAWSETFVEGGKPFTGTLAHPPSNTGRSKHDIHEVIAAPAGSAPIPQFYADSVVIAYRRTAGDVPFESLHAKITASGGSPDLAMLTDGDLERQPSCRSPQWARVRGFNTSFHPRRPSARSHLPPRTRTGLKPSSRESAPLRKRSRRATTARISVWWPSSPPTTLLRIQFRFLG